MRTKDSYELAKVTDEIAAEGLANYMNAGFKKQTCYDFQPVTSEDGEAFTVWCMIEKMAPGQTKRAEFKIAARAWLAGYRMAKCKKGS